MITMTILGIIYIYYLNINYTSSVFNKFPLNALFFFVWYPFYHFGFFLRKYEISFEKYRNIFWILLITFLILSIIEGFLWANYDNYSFGISQLKMTSKLFSLTLFILVVSYSQSLGILSRRSLLSWLGKKLLSNIFNASTSISDFE